MKYAKGNNTATLGGPSDQQNNELRMFQSSDVNNPISASEFRDLVLSEKFSLPPSSKKEKGRKAEKFSLGLSS